MISFFKKFLAVIMSILMFLPYMTSFLNKNIDSDFTLTNGTFSEGKIFLNGDEINCSVSGDFDNGKLILSKNAKLIFDENDCDFFNYYALSYKTNSYIKGTVTYIESYQEKSEDFFLTPDKNEFYSFTDNYLDKKKATEIVSLEFSVLNNDEAEIEIYGISTFNRKVENEVIYAENEYLKIGIDLHWGGALSYLEDLNSNVEVVKSNGKTKVDSNAGERYNEKVLNKNVNLINCYDSGRLVQQSYYGTFDGGYVGGEFIGQAWNYNPVQGGNKYNESSKIVDLKTENNSIYVKCRPLDWSLEKEKITSSYMEATYILNGDELNVSCKFIDFSGYPAIVTTQEMPAFYCVEPLDHFYYCENSEIKCIDDLIFWPDAGYPNFVSNENWVAFAGEFSDSFAIGLYVTESKSFLAGIYGHGETENNNPSLAATTSYVANCRILEFKSYSTIEYDYAITTGTVEQIREKFAGR